MSVKKAFEPLVAFLLENQDKKVRSIMAEITELCSAKGAGGTATTIRKDEAGVVTHIFDYYFKKWMPVEFVEFGKKAGSASGYSTMSKEGTSHWTKQQREYKQGKEALLDAVVKGEIQPSELASKLEQLETAKDRIVPYSIQGIGWDTIEEALAVSNDQLNQLVQEHNKRVAEAAEVAAKATQAA
jgi:hypothetical protein